MIREGYHELSNLMSSFISITMKGYKDKRIVDMINMFYKPTFEYPEYTSFDNYTLVNRSVEFIVLANAQYSYNGYVNPKSIELTYVKSHLFHTIVTSDFVIEKCITQLNEYLREVTKFHSTVYWSFAVVAIVISIILWFPVVYVPQIVIRNEKAKVLKCFNALPSNVMKEMCLSMNSKKENTNTSTDTNILQIQVIFRRKSPHLDPKFIFAVYLPIISIAAGFVLDGAIYGRMYYMEYLLSPLNDYVMGSMTQMNSCFACYIIIRRNDKVGYHIFTRDCYVNLFIETINTALVLHEKISFGDESIDLKSPTSLFGLLPQHFCSINGSSEESFFECFGVFEILIYVSLELKNIYAAIISVEPKIGNIPRIEFLWSQMIKRVNPEYFWRRFKKIAKEQNETIKDKFNAYAIGVCLSTLIGIFGIYFISRYYIGLQHNIRSAFRLLMHAPPEIIIKSHYIMGVVGNDFNVKELSFNMSDSFLSKIISAYPQPMCFINKITTETNYNKVWTSKYQNVIFELPTNDEETRIINIDELTLKLDAYKLSDEYVGFILTDLTKIENIEKLLLNEKRKYLEIRNKVIPFGVEDLISSENATVVCLKLISEDFPNFTNYVLSKIDEINGMNCDIIELITNRLFIILGLRGPVSISNVVRSVVYLMSSVKENNIGMIRGSVISNGSVQGIVNGISFDLSGSAFSKTEKLLKVSKDWELLFMKDILIEIFNQGYEILDVSPLNSISKEKLFKIEI